MYLHQALFLKAGISKFAADNNMIQNLNAQHIPAINKSLCGGNIFLTRGRIATRVIVQEDN